MSHQSTEHYHTAGCYARAAIVFRRVMARRYKAVSIVKMGSVCCPDRAHIVGDMVTLGRCPRLDSAALSVRKVTHRATTVRRELT